MLLVSAETVKPCLGFVESVCTRNPCLLPFGFWQCKFLPQCKFFVSKVTMSTKRRRRVATDWIWIHVNSFWGEGNKHGKKVVLGMAGKKEEWWSAWKSCCLTVSLDVQALETPQLGWERVLENTENSPALSAVAWMAKCIYWVSFMTPMNGDGGWAAGRRAEQLPWLSVPWRKFDLHFHSDAYHQELPFAFLWSFAIS